MEGEAAEEREAVEATLRGNKVMVFVVQNSISCMHGFTYVTSCVIRCTTTLYVRHPLLRSIRKHILMFGNKSTRSFVTQCAMAELQRISELRGPLIPRTSEQELWIELRRLVDLQLAMVGSGMELELRSDNY